MSKRFQFFEVVVVTGCSNIQQQALIGSEGTILGMAQDEESKCNNYAVSMDSTGIVYCFDEWQLASTGRMKNREDFYSGESLKVIVDPKTGKGSVRQ